MTRAPPQRRSRTLYDLLPSWFPPLLASDDILQRLWHGRGLPEGVDRSVVAYDITTAAYLCSFTPNAEDLAMVLAFRPVRKEERFGRSGEYLYGIAERAYRDYQQARGPPEGER